MYTYSFLNIYLFPKTHSMLESACPRKDERMDILPYINLSLHSDIATISKWKHIELYKDNSFLYKIIFSIDYDYWWVSSFALLRLCFYWSLNAYLFHVLPFTIMYCHILITRIEYILLKYLNKYEIEKPLSNQNLDYVVFRYKIN